jgi:hypothetical protein
MADLDSAVDKVTSEFVSDLLVMPPRFVSILCNASVLRVSPQVPEFDPVTCNSYPL